MSYAVSLLSRLVGLPDPHGALNAALDEMSAFELTVLANDFESFWARPKQVIPDSSWQSFGLLTGRGFGKSRCLMQATIREIFEGRARRVGIMGQSMDRVMGIMVEGESGILACSPPWFRAQLIKGHIQFPNGAIVTPYSAEVPESLRGPEHDLFVCDELVAWGNSTRDEAFSNMTLGLRLGYGRLLWSSTPKRRHPLIKQLLDRAAMYPMRHIVVRGSSIENKDNLTKGAIDEMIADFGDTQRGKEELFGEFFDESAGALWKDAYINDHRRLLPDRLDRHILAIDPAITSRKGSDSTGLIRLASKDTQVYVCEDKSGKMSWEEWGTLAIQLYSQHKMDCIVVETNRGGEGIAANLRACGERYGKTIQVVGADAVTRHSPSVVLVKEAFARSAKESRAEPVASLYERGRVSHVKGADLADLESTLTTWEPGPGPSPDALDALVWGVWELAGLSKKTNTHAFAGLDQANRILTSPARPSISALLANAGRGRTI